MLRLDDRWIWDSGVVDDGDSYHLFYLYAPRALLDPRLRHERARVGHATSTDLTSWQVHADALGPSGGWDDLAIWTGSTVRGDDGVWYLFYTALSTRGHGVKDQRIGLATSGDLFTWTRVGDRPAVVADPRWYRTLDDDVTASETWRDPFVQRTDDEWQMLITARVAGGRPRADGVLGCARSADLVHWEVLPPLGEPAGFGQIEVPQVRVVDGQAVLLFTCHPEEQKLERLAEWGDYCIWSVAGESPAGPWDLSRARPFTADPWLFAAQLAQRRDGGWVLLGFRNVEPEGAAFHLVDPVPVRVQDGVLRADS